MGVLITKRQADLKEHSLQVLHRHIGRPPARLTLRNVFLQAQIMAQSPSTPLRLIGSVFNFLYNRVPAAFEAFVVAGHGLSYAPSCSHHDGAAAPAAGQSTADYTLLRTGAVAAAAAVPTLQTASAAIRA